jgi:NAD(P)-dependent dehydrogenase (short-subunit alcohol dehydrogenase family)
VRELARKGAHVILTSRSMEKGNEAKNDICKDLATLPCRVDVISLDLSDFRSIVAFAKDVKEMNKPIDILILNAGVMASPFSQTKQGYELQIGTNHFGHFFLVRLLQGAIEAAGRVSGDARVVVVSSSAHKNPYPEGIRFDQLNNSQGYDEWSVYGLTCLSV